MTYFKPGDVVVSPNRGLMCSIARDDLKFTRIEPRSVGLVIAANVHTYIVVFTGPIVVYVSPENLVHAALWSWP